MIGWKLLKQPCGECTEIVIAPRGRKGNLHLVRCGKPASWRHTSRIAKRLRYCEEHKAFLDMLNAATKKAIISFIPELTSLRTGRALLTPSGSVHLSHPGKFQKGKAT